MMRFHQRKDAMDCPVTESGRIYRRCIERYLGNEISKTEWPEDDTVRKEMRKDIQVPTVGHSCRGHWRRTIS